LVLLQEAWIHRDFGTIQALLERKAINPNSFIFDFEHLEGSYLPILAHACRRGDTQLVSCLLTHGAQPAFWMLAAAFEAGQDDVVGLMAKRVDIDTLRGGISLLHSACYRLDVSAVDRLIRLGANVKKRAGTGAEVLVLVFPLGADPDRQVAVMTMLLDAGADMETRFQDLTPLALACRHNYIRALSLLLERGADPNADIGRGVRPLSLCCDPGVTPEIFAKVVEGGGRIPLDDALWLIGNGADSESARKRVCIKAAWNGPYDHRPVANRYFLS
jgi:ankyrin repeat protein